MIVTRTAIHGVMVVDLEPHVDERGIFARTFDADEFEALGMEPLVVQGNLSFNHRAGTFRGLHRQVPPHAEAKLVRCTAGAIIDIAVDVRPDSETRGAIVQVELSAANRRALFIAPYVAHGYLTSTDGAEVTYQVSGRYAPGGEQGFRYDDPSIGLVLPSAVTMISPKDASWPLLGGPLR